jgi:hypothetical protein
MPLFAALALAATLTLSGCAAVPGGKKSRPSKYATHNEAPRFGDWFVEPNRCTVEAATTDFTLTTDGKLTSNKLLPFKLSYNVPIAGPGTATLTGIPVPVPQDGTGKNYTIYLDYSARSVSELLNTGTFLTITYQPLSEGNPREAFFQTHGLIQAISELVRLCGR